MGYVFIVQSCLVSRVWYFVSDVWWQSTEVWWLAEIMIKGKNINIKKRTKISRSNLSHTRRTARNNILEIFQSFLQVVDLEQRHSLTTCIRGPCKLRVHGTEMTTELTTVLKDGRKPGGCPVVLEPPDERVLVEITMISGGLLLLLLVY